MQHKVGFWRGCGWGQEDETSGMKIPQGHIWLPVFIGTQLDTCPSLPFFRH